MGLFIALLLLLLIWNEQRVDSEMFYLEAVILHAWTGWMVEWMIQVRFGLYDNDCLFWGCFSFVFFMDT